MATVLALDVGSSSVRAQGFDDRAEPVDELRKEEYEGAIRTRSSTSSARRSAAADEDASAVGSSCFGHSLLALDSRRQAAHARARLAGHPELGRRRVASPARRSGGSTGAYGGAPPPELLAREARLARRDGARRLSAARHGSSRSATTSTSSFWALAPSCSLSIASGTGLLDVNEQCWDAELLEVLSLDESRLAPYLRRAARHLVSGGHRRRLLEPRRRLHRAGAGRSDGRHLRRASDSVRDRTRQPRPGLFLYRLDERRVVEGGALSDGGNLHAWLKQTLAGSDEDFSERDPDDHGLTFLTFLGGERSIGWDPDAKGAIDGLTFATTARDIRQAALEGVAFRFSAIADLLPEVEEIVATGGGLLSDPGWIQIMADALGRPVTASKIEEASLRGAAVATLERLGHEAAEAPLGEVFHPRQDRADAYRSARERQQRLYEELRGQD